MGSPKLSKKDKTDIQKRMEHLGRLASPKNFEIGARSRTNSIDLEILELKKRENKFNELIKNELLKLNIPIKRLKENDAKVKEKKAKVNEKKIKIVDKSLLNQRSLNTKMSPKTNDSTPVKNHRRYQKSFTLIEPKKRPITQQLPNIKLSPKNQDAVTKSDHSDGSEQPLKIVKNQNYRLKNINSIITSLESIKRADFSPVNSSIKRTGNTSKVVYDCLSTYCDCSSSGLEVSLSAIVQLKQDSIRLNEFLLSESNEMTNELSKFSNFVINPRRSPI